MDTWVPLLFSMLIGYTGCAQKPPVPPAPAPNPVSNADTGIISNSVASEFSKAEEKSASSQLSAKDLDRFNQVMNPVLTNNDKKAKLAYGRHYRYLPEIVQFAMDLRFKNYQHALELLPKWTSNAEEKAFWERLLSKKPDKLAKAICEDVSGQTAFPPLEYKNLQFEETPFGKELQDLAFTLAPKAKEKAKKASWSDLDVEINKLGCGAKKDPLSCGPIPSSLSSTLMKDSFYDKLRNVQRRDSNFYQVNAHTPLKISEYRGEFQRWNLYYLFRAITNTESPDRNHFLRRIRGIAKDMRGDVLFHRSIGSMVLNDDEDVKFVKRLKYFSATHPIISVPNHLDLELAHCKMPEVKTFVPIPYRNDKVKVSKAKSE